MKKAHGYVLAHALWKERFHYPFSICSGASAQQKNDKQNRCRNSEQPRENVSRRAFDALFRIEFYVHKQTTLMNTRLAIEKKTVFQMRKKPRPECGNGAIFF
jgi:hypothetical protein